MLFNSPFFLLLFLPVTLIGFFLLARWLGRNAALGFLLLASLLFYAYSSPFNLVLFLTTVVVNFLLGYAIAHSGHRPRAWLIGGIVLNLGLIGYFKYAGFLVSGANDVLSASFIVPHVVLPLGISFYTFEQISYLVETRQNGQAERSPIRYALFASFFPHLIAGPIIRPHQLLPQFSSSSFGHFNWQNFAHGTTFLLFGLFKKVILADGIAAFASPVFASAASGGTPGAVNAWGAALAYTFQIYFDFSGYSDMAIGLGLMFGIVLPFNFNSPYKATSIIDFWHRWHMTLSLFLRDYVYIPLGGSRRGVLRRYVNILLTMLIGGLWHGASWTFVAWGGVHGIFLLANHAWRGQRGERETFESKQWTGRIATFLLVVCAWVLFRSDNFAAAGRMFHGMRGLNGWINGPPPDPALWFVQLLQFFSVTIAPGWPAAGVLQLLWIVGLLAVVWALPNTQQFLLGEGRPADARVEWRPTLGWAAALGIFFGCAFTYSIVADTHVSEFIYFIF
jgi:D-alanyl-lipoteichoic acid acyltransferase DltB (MBOAT superfamily)